MKLVLMLAPVILFAQASSRQFSPDNLAPYIPSPQAVVDKMLEAARVKPGETVFDLGCGDGRIVITAAQKFKAKAVGIELSPELARRTTERVRELGLQNVVSIVQGNILKADLSHADVVTLYLLTPSNEKLKPALLKLRAGTRVVSHDYPIRGWKAAEMMMIPVEGHTHTIYVYAIGDHQLP